MKRFISKNWGWYVAVIILFGPFLLVELIEPDWMGRVVGLSLFYFLIPPIGIWILLQKENYIISKEAWLYKRYGISRVDLFSKIIICLGCSLFIFLLTVPFAKDLKLVFYDIVPEKTSKINYISVSTGALSLDLILDDMSSFEAPYFPRGFLEEGKTYKFLYLPNSQRIVDAELITEENS